MAPRLVGAPQVPHGMAALALSVSVCYLGTQAAAALAAPTQAITIITALTVALATAFPARLAPLVPSGEGLAMLLMMVCPAAGPSAQGAQPGRLLREWLPVCGGPQSVGPCPSACPPHPTSAVACRCFTRLSAHQVRRQGPAL